MSKQRTIFLFAFILILSIASFGQSRRAPRPTPTPTPDDIERVVTEEIKLNVIAFNPEGKFFPDVKVDDLVINEDNILHQPSSVRRIPANVVIVMDTGGEMRVVKSLDQTRKTAKAVVGGLRDGDQVAVIQYSDKAEILTEWTTDKAAVINAIGKKSTFGRRSVFVRALTLASDFLAKTPLENKHIVLITDGTDSIAETNEKEAAMKKLLSTDINVHVISYTRMEVTDIEPRTKGIMRSPPPKAMPDEVAATLPNGVRGVTTNPPASVSISTDRAFKKKMKSRKTDLEVSEKQMESLSENTNGEFILPETFEEMIEKAGLVAQMIDSSYVVTYVPKRPLSEVHGSETRTIDVSSKRPGLMIQAKRKLIVNN
jgi:von Willebrand factor type A domain